LSAPTPGQIGGELLRLRRVRRAVGGAELLGELPLVRQRVDRDDVLRAGEGGALHGVDVR
jgi:hypothetical protein